MESIQGDDGLTVVSGTGDLVVSIELPSGARTEVVFVFGETQLHLWFSQSWYGSFGREIVRMWLRAPWGDGDLIARGSGLCLDHGAESARVAVVVRDLPGTHSLTPEAVARLRSWSGVHER